MNKLKNLTLYTNEDRMLQLLLYVGIYCMAVYVVVLSGYYPSVSSRVLIIVYEIMSLCFACYELETLESNSTPNDFFFTPWLLSCVGVVLLALIASEYLFVALTVSVVLAALMLITTIAAPAGVQAVEPAKAPAATKAPAVKKTWIARFRKSNLFTWLCAICIALVIVYICPIGLVSGGSMLPTMAEEGTLVCKINDGAYEQGDIVMADSDDGTYRVVKRIIGVPGDTVCCMADGDIYVNGELLVLEGVTLGSTENLYGYSETVLGDDEYFLVGDNRRYSNDSRNPSVGAFTLDQIISEVVVIWK